MGSNPRVISNHAAMVAAGGPTLVYFDPPGGMSLGRRLSWFSRSGTVLSTTGNPGSLRDPRISPDGRSVAVGRANEYALFEIWKYDLARNVDSRVSSDGIVAPIWSSDGRSIITANDLGVFRFDAFAFGPPQLVRAAKNSQGVRDISPDGREAVMSVTISGKSRLATMPMDGSADP